MTRLALALSAASLVVSGACAPPSIEPTTAPSGVRAELWASPPANRDLFYGPGGRELAPTRNPRFKLKLRDPSGFSVTLDLEDARGREWSAKLGPEAQSEVVSSRLVWALGYHQPPSYFIGEFTVVEGPNERREAVARLRPKLEWLDSQDVWSWHQNPFVDTQPYRGLLVLMMMLNSTDLKSDNNTLYLVKRRGQAPRHWYVVKDLGATLGTTGKWYPERNDIDEFEKHGFIKDASGPYVEFAFAGRHQELLQRITVEDVKWTCRRLARLTDRQWDDAFRAGGYPEDTRRRYIRKLKDKVREGLALPDARGTR
jgi:hypothetical protein